MGCEVGNGSVYGASHMAYRTERLLDNGCGQQWIPVSLCTFTFNTYIDNWRVFELPVCSWLGGLMELWEEYFLRHNMPLVCPFEPFLEHGEIQIYIRPNPPEEHRLWAQFVLEHTDVVREVECGEMVVVWGVEIARSQLGLLPTLTEQQAILFSQLPRMEMAWNVFTRSPFRQRPALACLDNLRDFHRLLSVPNLLHPERQSGL